MRVGLLGSLDVTDDAGQQVAVRGVKLRRLLAVLALDAGRVVGIDRLVECVWGDDLPLKVDNALQVLVSKLRHALDPAGTGPKLIVTRSPGYLLDVDPDDVDTLQDLVVGALHDAARVAQQLQAEKMGPLAGGLGGEAGGLGLPGF